MPRTRLDPEYWVLYLRDELRKYKQKDLAKALGCTQQTVSNKIKTMNFTLPEMETLKKEFGIDIRKVVDMW